MFLHLATSSLVVKGLDGQLSIKLVNNVNEFSIGILALYLPPDNYIYGRDPENFFNQAAALWEDLSDCDLLVGSGDVNSRTKEIMEYIPEIDGNLIKPRYNPDLIKNSHADSFISFLKDNRSIILNGRVTPEYNNYTFVSPRGCSVPDYLFYPIDHHLTCFRCCCYEQYSTTQNIARSLFTEGHLQNFFLFSNSNAIFSIKFPGVYSKPKQRPITNTNKEKFEKNALGFFYEQ